MVIASPDGDTVVYRPSASGSQLEIPTAQAGPFGTTTTSLQPIDLGPSANNLDTQTKEMLRGELRIRYDARGVVQELSSP